MRRFGRAQCFGLLAILFSTSVFAVPASYTATPVFSTSTLRVVTNITAQSARGYCAQVQIRNVGANADQGWQVDFDLAGDSLKYLKQAEYSIAGSRVTVAPYPQKANIEAGRSTDFEFCTEGNAGPAPFRQSVTVSHRAPSASLMTQYTVDDKTFDEREDRRHGGDSGERADYCVSVSIFNRGPDDIYDWRLAFNLGADQLVSLDHGRADGDTGRLVVAPATDDSSIKNGERRVVKFCARAPRVACIRHGDENEREKDHEEEREENRLHVSILSPADGAVVPGEHVFVRGTYSGPANTAVTVNGVVAIVDGAHFYANDVPLSVGANKITAVAATLRGRPAMDVSTVTRSGDTILDFNATATNGSAPLATRFAFGFDSGNPIASISIDYEGDGVVDLVTADPAVLLTHIYAQPGVYLPQLTVTDASGAVYVKTYAIQVVNTDAIAAIAESLFTGLRQDLACGDVHAALGYLTAGARERYRPVFKKLGPHFPRILAEWSPLQRSIVTAEYAEYAVNRAINGENRIFLIYFVQDADGVWRIESM